MSILARIGKWMRTPRRHDCMFNQNDVLAHATFEIHKIGNDVKEPRCVICNKTLTEAEASNETI